MSSISIKQLLEAGVHFGHQTSRWNPKMKEYIFGERNGIHIIDLQQTIKLFKEAVDFMAELAASGKEVLFVGTKKQAQECIEEDARRCGMHFVTSRWLGGLLTNFKTVQNSIKRYKELQSMKESGFYNKLSKKEVAQLERERKRLEKNLLGIQSLRRLPDAVFVIDSEKEAIAVKEAAKLGIPVVAVVDTNCDPSSVDYVIPGNDDALRSIKLFTSTIAEAVLAGRSLWDAKVAEEERIAREKAEKEAAARKAAKEAARAEKARKEAAAAARAAEAAKTARANAEVTAVEEGAAKVKATKGEPVQERVAQPDLTPSKREEEAAAASESAPESSLPGLESAATESVAASEKAESIKEGEEEKEGEEKKRPSKKAVSAKKTAQKKSPASRSKPEDQSEDASVSSKSAEASAETTESTEEEVKAES